MPLLARDGFAEFSLEELAERADVTRNLLYHYFPRGRADIVLAAVDRAGRLLTADWVTGDSLPLSQRLAANFARMAAHATEPTDAWRIQRRARAADAAELNQALEPYIETVISGISVNHFGTPHPPALVRLALRGFLAFGETVLDEARAGSVPLPQILRVLSDTLVATIDSARE
jgi:AcrR family transcriptional regulator